MSQATEVPSNVPLNLRLLLGGDLPYKWSIYEYSSGGGQPTALPSGTGEGDQLVQITPVPPQDTRKFVWSVAAVNDDDTDTGSLVEIRAQALTATATVVGEYIGTWEVPHPAGTCYVHFNLVGKS